MPGYPGEVIRPEDAVNSLVGQISNSEKETKNKNVWNT